MSEITLQGARGSMPIYLATPTSDGPWSSVLVISDALGMTTDLRNQADWLAENGYLAAAPDLYYWGGRLRCMFSVIRQAVKREGDVWSDFETIRTWLSQHEAATGKVGVIGFCMGGGFALLLAGLAEYDASSVNYGDVPKDALELLADACPIVGSYGALDTLKEAPVRLEKTMSELGIPHDVKVYPDAGHSFLNDHDPDEAPAWAVIAGKFSKSEYHEPSAIDARRRIVDFFGTHLRN